ncbi:MAG: nucleotidyltransferase domain-containing protein [Candidatus Poribacteria bacterium]|nr:nucleotidyltransferase domain-containing protein [Candidatus Poribacteria bacterium]
MVTRQEIQATCDDIVREFAPLQVILFGSYAYGTPTEDSDVDLLVVMDIPKSEFLNKKL